MKDLTERQFQIVRLLAEGMTLAEIGAELGITERTVKSHAITIRHKFGVEKSRLIVPAARSMGLL